jgi:hypothetical protein
MHTYSVRADAGLLKQLVDIWRFATAELNSTVPGWRSRLLYQVISKNMIRTSDEKGGNVLGLQARGDPLVGKMINHSSRWTDRAKSAIKPINIIVVVYISTWIRPEDDDKVYVAIDKLLSTSTNLAESQNRLDDYMCVPIPTT